MSTIYRDLVEVGAFQFNAPAPVGYDYRVDALIGWEDGPELEVTISDYEVSDGGSPGFFAAKSKFVTVEGYVFTGGRGGSEAVKTALGAALPRNTDLVVRRYSPVPKQMTMRRASRITFPEEMNGYDDALRFSVDMVATDPLRYSVAEIIVTTGISTPDESGRIYPRVYPLVYTPLSGADTGNLGVSITNLGNAPTYPITYVNGPVDAGGWQIANDTTGQRLTFNISLATGQQLMIDHANHLLKFNGYPAVYRAEGDWWAIVPGENFLRFTSSTYNATASIEVHARSAWE